MAPNCFREHEKSKCHAAALVYETTIPKCGDPKEMISDQIVKKRERERHYLTIVMEPSQYLARQGIAFRGNDDFDDNCTQLLLLRAKDHPWIKERIMSKQCGGTKKYIHHHFQDEILDIMAKQVLRKNFMM